MDVREKARRRFQSDLNAGIDLIINGTDTASDGGRAIVNAFAEAESADSRTGGEKFDVCVFVKEEPRDTNPDAAAAEAAQDASKWQGYHPIRDSRCTRAGNCFTGCTAKDVCDAWENFADRLEATHEAAEAENAELRRQLATMTADRDKVRSQLPDEMKDCEIRYVSCEVGHGRLAAANWIDHGCPHCKVDKQAALIEALRGQAEATRAAHGLTYCMMRDTEIAALERVKAAQTELDKVTPRDTNPDAAAAEAAQDAVAEPVHGQGPADECEYRFTCNKGSAAASGIGCCVKRTDDWRRRYDAMTAENAELRKANEGLRTQVAAKQRGIENRDETIAILEASLLEARNTNWYGDYTATRERLNATELARVAAVAERDGLCERIASLERQILAKYESNNSLRSSNEVLREQLVAMTAERNSSRVAVKATTGERDAARTIKEGLSKRVVELSSHLDARTAERDALAEKLAGMTAARDALGKDCESLRGRCYEAEGGRHTRDRLIAMAAERDALAKKFEGAKRLLRDAARYAEIDRNGCGLSNMTLDDMQFGLDKTLEYINRDIAILEKR